MPKRLRPQSNPRPAGAIPDGAALQPALIAIGQSLRQLARKFELERLWIFLLLWRLKPHQQPPCTV